MHYAVLNIITDQFEGVFMSYIDAYNYAVGILGYRAEDDTTYEAIYRCNKIGVYEAVG